MQASRVVLLVALALLGIAALRDFARLGDALPWRQLYDFADFYCAGAALDAQADPYRYEPLHRCEHAVSASPVFRADPRRVIPAPLPPYDFPPFMMAAQLPFSLARAIDAIAIGATVALAMWGLSLVAGSLEVAVLALILPAGFVLLAAGQVVPFALLMLVFCGLAVARDRDALAGLAAAGTLVEPHLGLPACIALFAWRARSRAALVVGLVALGALAAAVAGIGGIVEYIARVLPAQGAAESGYAYQYSLTYALQTLGIPPGAALIAGDVSYVAALAAGVWLGRRAAGRLERPELVVYLPAACSIVGGPYVHMVDLAFAVPATLVLARACGGPARIAAVAALCCFAVPWISVWITKKLFLAALLVVALLLTRLRPGAAASAVIFAAIAASIYALELWPPAPLAATTAGLFAAGDLAQLAWRQYVEQLGTPGLPWLLVKLPTWLAMAAMLGSAFVAVRERAEPAPT